MSEPGTTMTLENSSFNVYEKFGTISYRPLYEGSISKNGDTLSFTMTGIDLDEDGTFDSETEVLQMLNDIGYSEAEADVYSSTEP